jgi:capsular polysaccharide biosynthesis protein
MLEAFFRRWWLYVLPVILLGAIGVVSVAGASTKYRSTGVILVSRQTLLSEISSLNSNTNNFGVQSPATYTSDQINTVLNTDNFLESVITTAGLQSAIDSGAITRDQVRASIGASPRGDELVGIASSTSDPELAYRLAQATIESYVQWEIDNLKTDSAAAVTALEQLVARQEQLVSQAGGTSLDATALQQARDQLTSYRAQLDQARQVGEQTATDVAQRLRVIDQPEQPTAPESGRKKAVQTLLLFVALGVVVAGAALVTVTLLDHSVRYTEEVEDRFDLPVLATVPDSPSARLSVGL